MSTEPTPLPIGAVLSERFEILGVLGRGGYGIAYRAQDLVRSDQVAIKELAPSGVRRNADGILLLDEDSHRSAHLLRQRFQQEALLLRKVRSSGVPNLRTTFVENGTCYAVTDYVAGSETLAKVLLREGRLAEEAVREILVSVLDILEHVHAAGVLHRDIKPSNILVLPHGGLMLIDFGSAREYTESTQTVMYSPGYAPLEQLSERATRGPATDLYSLAATLYEALVGALPSSATDRAAGIPLLPIREVRKDVDPVLASSIDAALGLKMADRPQSVADWRRQLSEDAGPEPVLDLQQLDRLLVKARELRFDRKGCPGCHGVLQEVRPLRKLACPVCREGTIRPRDLDDDRCPNCREGRVRTYANKDPMVICPTCREGVLSAHRKSIWSRDVTYQCGTCRAEYTPISEGWRRNDDVTRGVEEWLALSGRADEVRVCDTCRAQWDRRPDQRWQQIAPERNAIPLYLDEWARIAAGISPGAGNAECNGCGADYWLEPNRLTLLDTTHDPYRFAEDFIGRSLQIEDVRWLGVGKSSGGSGPVCDQCGTEFDREGDQLRLVRSPHRLLSRNVGEVHSVVDWHRIASGLPSREEEAQYEARIDTLLREAFRMSKIPFETGSPDLHWKGRARRESDGQDATLVVLRDEVRFGGPLRKWRRSLSEMELIEGAGTELTFDGETFEIEQVELSADLRSGPHQLLILAEDVVARIDSQFATGSGMTDAEEVPPEG